MDNSNRFRQLHSASATTAPPPELINSSMEFLLRSWSPTSFQIAKALSPRLPPRRAAEAKHNDAGPVAENPFTFACSATSQLVMERIMSHSQEVSQLSSGRVSYSSGPMSAGSLSDSPPFTPSDWEDVQELPFLAHSYHTKNNRTTIPQKQSYRGESRTLSNLLKDCRKQKEETLAHNTKLQAAVSIASLAAAVSAISAATASALSIEDDCAASANLAIASAATLVAAQCIEAAEVLGAEQSHLAAGIAAAVNVRTPGDIVALTTSAASALRGAEMMKARVFKEMWNIAAVIPVEKGYSGHGSRYCDGEGGGLSCEIMAEENLMGLWSLEVIARGAELLKRSRTGIN